MNLARCTAALLLFASAPLLAQAKWIGDRNAMSGELDALAINTNNRAVTYPLTTPAGDGSVTAKISMRYRLWRLVGEPVWTFEPKYELGTIRMGRNVIDSDSRLAAGTIDGILRPDGGVTLNVAPDVFALIRVRDMFFSARFTQNSPDNRPVYKNGWVTAVFGKPGEWGWDVPGSPSWQQTFTPTGEALERGGAIRQWLDADSAKDCWQQLHSQWQANQSPALKSLRCYRLKLDYSSFLSTVERLQPGVTRPFFQRMERGESFEQAADRNSTEFQVQSLLNGIARERDEGRSADGASTESPALRRRLAITTEAFALLGDTPPSYLQEQLEQATQRVASEQIDLRVRALAEQVVSWNAGSAKGDDLPAALAQQFDALGNDVKALGNAVSPASKRRWQSLASLQPGRAAYAESLAIVKRFFARYATTTVTDADYAGTGDTQTETHTSWFREVSRGVFEFEKLSTWDIGVRERREPYTSRQSDGRTQSLVRFRSTDIREIEGTKITFKRDIVEKRSVWTRRDGSRPVPKTPSLSSEWGFWAPCRRRSTMEHYLPSSPEYVRDEKQALEAFRQLLAASR